MSDSPIRESLAFTASEPEVTAALRQFYSRLVRIAPRAEEILEVARQFPAEPAAQIAAALFWLFGQTPEAQARSVEYLALARNEQARLNPREKAWLGALTLWHERRFESAASAFEAITTKWPEDLVAAKAAEFLYYILGQQASGPRFRAHAERLAAVQKNDPDFLALRAFAHELCGDVGAARDYAEQALEITPHNPWAQHALEHVLLWEGSPEAAVNRLESWLGTWDQAGRVIHCHNAWHVALMHLDRLNSARAFAVYEDHVWGKSPGMVVEQLDAIAFLWRAEMAGLEVESARFREIVPHIAPLADTLFMPFVSAHYAYALARADEGDALEKLLHAVDERSACGDEDALWAWAPVGRGIIRGAAALGQGNAPVAAEWFEPVMDRMTRIGGSDAQDDLFRFAYLDSLIRAGRRADARPILERRLGQKAPSPLEEQLIASLN